MSPMFFFCYWLTWHKCQIACVIMIFPSYVVRDHQHCCLVFSSVDAPSGHRFNHWNLISCTCMNIFHSVITWNIMSIWAIFLNGSHCSFFLCPPLFIQCLFYQPQAHKRTRLPWPIFSNLWIFFNLSHTGLVNDVDTYDDQLAGSAWTNQVWHDTGHCQSHFEGFLLALKFKIYEQVLLPTIL